MKKKTTKKSEQRFQDDIHEHKHHHHHPSHPEIVKRLKRVTGHLQKVVHMIEHEEECVDILQQLSAVISGLTNARTALLMDHVQTCFTEALKPGHEHILKEVELIFKRTVKD